MMAKEHLVLEKIGWVRSDFPSKFGIPRQSGLIEELKATIIFSRPIVRQRHCGGWQIFPIFG